MHRPYAVTVGLATFILKIFVSGILVAYFGGERVAERERSGFF